MMMEKVGSVSALLLAGGSGTRMQTAVPKQFLELHGKAIALHSFELFLGMPEIDEIIVVCDPSYQSLFKTAGEKPVRFAQPGQRRQDSVYNGFLESAAQAQWICIHDSARPFIDHKLVLTVLEAAKQHGAAAAGVPLKFTIKECSADKMVKTTPDRAAMWEVQTPQILHRPVLQRGFDHAHSQGLTVTDDVLLAELVGQTVKLVEGSEHNIKITVPADYLLAQQLLKER